MLQLIIAIFLGLAYPTNTHGIINNDDTTIITLDTGGEDGHIPPGDVIPLPPIIPLEN